MKFICEERTPQPNWRWNYSRIIPSDHNTSTSQTDGRADKRTTCRSNTALCIPSRGKNGYCHKRHKNKCLYHKNSRSFALYLFDCRCSAELKWIEQNNRLVSVNRIDVFVKESKCSGSDQLLVNYDFTGFMLKHASAVHRHHTHTVVWECCKDDSQSQWEVAKFDPQPTLNPLTDRHQIWTRSQAVARIADRTASQQTLVISDCC